MELTIEDRGYNIDVHRRTTQPPDAPRLVVVSYLPNDIAADVLRVCVRAIQQFTTVPYELWVVDNCSPEEHCAWLTDWTDLNVVFNRTEPLPPARPRKRFGLVRTGNGQGAGSWANAVALEIAARVIDTDSHHLMTLHMDTMPSYPGWLSFLVSKIAGNVAAAGVRMDTGRTPEGVLHCLGMLIDFQRFRELQLDFKPDLPRYDVGDRITVGLRKHGHDVFACRNTLWQPELVDRLPVSSPFRTLPVDRALDDDGNVIFLHLGRGVSKAKGSRRAGATPREWIHFAEEYVFAR